MQFVRLLIIPGILAISLFLTVDFVEQVNEDPTSTGFASGIDYNGYSEGINTVQFDEFGRIEYTVSASRQVTFMDNRTELEQPFVQLYRDNDSRWNIVANSGRISSNRDRSTDVDEIVLSGNVEIYRLDESDSRILLLTEVIAIDPGTEILTTGAHVTMFSDSLEQSAVGMQINLNTDEYVFYRNVRGRYAAIQN